MPLKAGEIADMNRRLIAAAGCNMRHPVENSMIRSLIQVMAFSVSRENEILNPDAKEGEPIPDELEISNSRLLEMLANIEDTMTEIEICEAFEQILPDDEIEAFLLFTSLFTKSSNVEATDEERKNGVREHILPQINPKSVMWPVMQAFLNDKNANDAMKKAIAERGGKIAKIEKPESVETFIRLFRREIQRHIGNPAQA
jgi:hypothetical protein